MKTFIGPARHYAVRISHTADDDLVLGRIGRLEVIGEDVRVAGRLPLERLEMRLDHVRYTGGGTEFLSVQESSLLAEVSESSLNQYLADYHAREGVQTHFTDGEVAISLILPLLGVPTRIQSTGKLAIAGGKRLVFVVDQVEAPREPLFGPGKEFIERQLNPLIDMEELGVPVRFTDVQVSDGHVMIRGSADLPTEPPPSARRR